MSAVTAIIQHNAESLSQCSTTRKINRTYTDGKGGKPYPSVQSTWLCIKFKESFENLLKITGEFSKVAGYKIIKKSMYFYILAMDICVHKKFKYSTVHSHWEKLK